MQPAALFLGKGFGGSFARFGISGSLAPFGSTL
jgi:hypothetical protein